jgi:DNA-binding NarL/FixJ family response regulator
VNTCVVVDPHFAVREGLRAHFAQRGIADVVGIAATGVQAIRAVEEHRPDVVVIDLDGDTPRVITELRARGLDVPTVVFSTISDPYTVTRALSAGASGYVIKETSSDLLDQAIEQVLSGKRFVDPDVAFTLVDAGDTVITPREREVLTLASRGLPNKSIAYEMAIGTETVRTHMASVIGKLDAGNRTGAVAKALRLTLIH